MDGIGVCSPCRFEMYWLSISNRVIKHEMKEAKPYSIIADLQYLISFTAAPEVSEVRLDNMCTQSRTAFSKVDFSSALLPNSANR